MVELGFWCFIYILERYLYIVLVWVYLGVLCREHGVKLLSYPPSPKQKMERYQSPLGDDSFSASVFCWRVKRCGLKRVAKISGEKCIPQ